MTRDHAAFAAELRADALGLRQMADALEHRAIAHDRLAEGAPGEDRALTGIPTAFAMNMAEGDHAAWVERIIRRAALGRPAIDEDHCAFGLRYVGSALAPVLDYT